MKEETNKTPDYTKKAIKAYNERHDKITIALQKGTKDRIKTVYGAGVNISGYIQKLIDDDLTRKETI